MATICTVCGNDVTGKRFCSRCGTAVQSSQPATASQGNSQLTSATCPRCGGEVHPGSAFCMHCGSALNAQASAPARPAIQICPSCNAEVPAGNAFCTNCGQSLRSGAAPVQSQPTQPAATLTCANCGRQNAPGMRFCANCGSPLAAPATASGYNQYAQNPQQYQQPYGQQQYPSQYNQQYNQQYGQSNMGGYQQQAMMGQGPMMLRCPVCMAYSQPGTPICPGCRTNLAGVVPVPANMSGQGQQGMLGGLGGALQGGGGNMAMGALGGAAAVIGGEMLLHGLERNIEDRVEGDGGYGYEHHRHHHRERDDDGPLGDLGNLANDIGLF